MLHTYGDVLISIWKRSTEDCQHIQRGTQQSQKWTPMSIFIPFATVFSSDKMMGLSHHGLMFPPDPTSRNTKECSIETW